MTGQKKVPVETKKIKYNIGREDDGSAVHFLLGMSNKHLLLVMKFSTLNQIILLIGILATKIEWAQGCDSGQYFSVDIPGCIACPSNCSHQDTRDVDRCRKACGRCYLNILSML